MNSGFINIGTASIDISPLPGVELCGYAAREGGNVGIHDKLYAKTIAMDDGTNKAAILSCDLVGMDSEIIDYVKNEVNILLSIDQSAVMISCTHTHSGPVTMRGNGIGLKNEDYILTLKGKLIESIVTAFRSMQPANAFYSKGRCNIGINRRGKIKEGSIEPSVDPNGPVDSEVSVIAFYNSISGDLITLLFNYGCHPVVLNPDNNFVSADYPGAACSFIEISLQLKIPVVFTNGGAGNINPKERGSFGKTLLNGEKLGSAVLDILNTEKRKLTPKLSYGISTVDLPFEIKGLIEVYQKTIAEHKKLLETVKPGSVDEKLSKANIIWAEKYLKEAENNLIPEKIRVNLQVIKIGDLFLVGIPTEVFAETTMWIKKNSGADVIVLGYTNGNEGYLPTREEIPKGGYEVLEAHKYYDRPAHYSVDADDNVRYAAQSLISKIRINSSVKS